MSRKPPIARQPPPPTAREHRPDGRNPRNVPAPRLDASPPHPAAPEQSELEKQQDQQPVHPAPLIGGAPNPSRGTREEKNG